MFIADRRHYRAATGNRRLAQCAALNRINALACIMGARHGWLGASFSVAELLTVLYCGLREKNVILSKGHAAPLQYACLYATGVIGKRALHTYKDGPRGLQAHTDIATPGILVNSGSLGQALSKAAGMAYAVPRERFYVILGDGELQEGQNFEALQTVAHLRLRNLTVIIDANVYQTEQAVAAVKGIADYHRVFSGLGYTVLDIDGHDCRAVRAALTGRGRGQKLIIARTQKAGGSRFLRPVRGKQPWHGQVPDAGLYRALVREQAALSGNRALQTEVERWCRPPLPAVAPVAPVPAVPATRDLFWQALRPHLQRSRRLVVLDADLAKSCGLQGLPLWPRQFVELGISEQDMVSFAGGLARRGLLPVVNTYASFYKRAYEQVCVNQTERSAIMYAGHYAGLDYHTDGKTHQSLNDLSLMRTVPGLAVFEPVSAAQMDLCVRWAVRQRACSSYFRLHRTPLALDLPPQHPRLDRPLVAGGATARCFLTGGTVGTALALACRRERDFRGWSVMVQGVFGLPVDTAWWRQRLAGTRELVTIADNRADGGLHEWACALIARLGLRVRVTPLAPSWFGPSFRSFDDCLRHFGFTPDGVRAARRRA